MGQYRPRGLLALFLFCALAACGGSPEQPQISRASGGAVGAPVFGDNNPHDWVGRAPWHYQVHGVDVSRYQGDIDWQRLLANNISFAFIKATEGGDVADSMFELNWALAREAGMPRGAYHYYYFCRSAEEQAKWFIDHVPLDNLALPPVLDAEWTQRSRTCPFRPAPEVVRSEMSKYLLAVGRRYGKRPIIYSTVDFYADNELWRVMGYSFWLRSVAGHPSVTYPSQDWVLWQYTGTGLVPGIEGQTDLNVFAGSRDDFRRWVSG